MCLWKNIKFRNRVGWTTSSQNIGTNLVTSVQVGNICDNGGISGFMQHDLLACHFVYIRGYFIPFFKSSVHVVILVAALMADWKRIIRGRT